MQRFKIDHFKKDNPKHSFPQYRSLNEKELYRLQEKLFNVFNVYREDSLLSLVKKIDLLESVVDGISIIDDNFSLQKIFNALKIKSNNDVYINWYRYDDIDSMKLSDLDTYFFDVWYPGSDDIDIFDETCSWVFSVRHDGVLSLTNNLQPQQI